jgi:hypothetical protein
MTSHGFAPRISTNANRWAAPSRVALPATLLLCCLFLAPRSTAQDKTAWRDWAKHPILVEVDTTEDIYALGDIHGDYERLLTILVAAKIIPADPGPPYKVQWQAGKAVLVCTGDFIDKYDQSLRVIALLRALQDAAARSGGRFIVALGNHEAEFLANPRITKAAAFVKELEIKNVKPEDVASGKDAEGIGQWLRSLPVAARVNDWFFVHAGKTHNRTFAQLRTDLESGLAKDGFKTPVLQDLDSLVLARMNPMPWWEKEGDSGAQSKETLAKSVHALGVKHLVIGHHPGNIKFADKTKRAAGELDQHFDGLIFFIDVGMSRAVAYSTGAILHIHREGQKVHAYRILATGKPQQIWAQK